MRDESGLIDFNWKHDHNIETSNRVFNFKNKWMTKLIWFISSIEAENYYKKIEIVD